MTVQGPVNEQQPDGMSHRVMYSNDRTLQEEGGLPPPRLDPSPPHPPPIPVFEADSQNFALVPRGFTLQNLRPPFGGDHRGTLGGRGVPAKPPPLILPLWGGGGHGCAVGLCTVPPGAPLGPLQKKKAEQLEKALAVREKMVTQMLAGEMEKMRRESHLELEVRPPYAAPGPSQAL